MVAQTVKRLPTMRETRVRSLGREHPPGEGNGNPLQYSCLENPMDGGAWWATVHGVAKSRTRLSDFPLWLICVIIHLSKPIEYTPPRVNSEVSYGLWVVQLSSVQFSRSVVSDSLRPHESQHARPPCPPPTPWVHSDFWVVMMCQCRFISYNRCTTSWSVLIVSGGYRVRTVGIWQSSTFLLFCCELKTALKDSVFLKYTFSV